MSEEAVDYGEIRRKVHEALQQIISEEENESTILAGWNLIWEGIHEDNKRSLSFVTSDATGEESLTPWATLGYMNHVESLYHIITGYEEDDSEEENDYDD